MCYSVAIEGESSGFSLFAFLRLGVSIWMATSQSLYLSDLLTYHFWSLNLPLVPEHRKGKVTDK